MNKYRVGDVLKNAVFGPTSWVVINRMTVKGGFAQNYDFYHDRHKITCLPYIDNKIINTRQFHFYEDDIYPYVEPIGKVTVESPYGMCAPI